MPERKTMGRERRWAREENQWKHRNTMSQVTNNVNCRGKIRNMSLFKIFCSLLARDVHGLC